MNARTRAVCFGTLLGTAALAFARYRRRRALELAPSLAGRHAFVTGGSRGLGFLLARELIAEGASVTICARDGDELDRAQSALAASDGEVDTRVCDVSNRESVEKTIEDIEQTIGPIDVLVNNAGIITVGPVETLSVEDYESALGVMFWGMVYPTLAVVPHMMARGGGRIVNISSIGGKMSVPHLSSYCAAKFAALGFSEGLHAELARYGIRVTSVVPGLMRTGSHLNAYFKGAHEDEYRWFGLGASLPGLSVDAERAARSIIRAVKRGDAEYVVGWPAKIAARAQGLFPALTAEIARAVNDALPHRTPSHQRVQGSELEPSGSRLWKALTARGRDSARRYQTHQA